MELERLVCGPSNCAGCSGAVIIAVDETGRYVLVAPDPVPTGALVMGLEEDALGDQPEPGLVRVRRATPDDPEGPRWALHQCISPDPQPRAV